MAQTVELGIKININGNQPAVDGINQITDATERMGASSQNVAATIAAGQKELGNSTAQLTVGQLKFLDSLKDQAAAAGLTKTQLLELQAAQMGLSDVSAGLIAQIDAATASGNNFSLATAGATRELAVLGREIAAGNVDRLAGSMTVLASRAGLLPLLFTPIGAALAALALTVGAFGVAAIEGSEQQEKLLQALDITGNMAGLTETKIDAMAQSMGNIGNAGAVKAQEILTGLAASGRFTADTFEVTGRTAVAFAQATGQSSESVVSEFTKMTDNVVAWAEEHNKQYHAMTAADLDYVRQLVAEGQTAEATRIVMQAFYGDFSTHVAKVGLLEGAWNKLTNAVKSSWQAMMNVGKDATLAEQIAQVQTQIDQETAAVNGRFKGNTDSGNGQVELQRLQADIAQMAQLKAQARAADTAAALQASQKRHEELQDQGNKEWAQIVAANRNRHEQMIDDIEAVTAAAKKAGIDQQTLEIEKARIIAKYADNSATAQIVAQQKAQDTLRQIAIKSEADDIASQLKLGQISQSEFDAKMTNNALEANASQQQYEQAVLRINGLSAAEKQMHAANLQALKAQADAIQNSGVNKFLADQKAIYDQIFDAVAKQGEEEQNQLDAAIAKQKQHNDEIGKTAAQKEIVLRQIDAEKLAEAELSAQQLRDAIASGTLNDNDIANDQHLLNFADLKIDKLKQLIALKTQGATLDAAVDQKKIDTQQFDDAVKAAKNMETELTTSFGNIGTAIGKMAEAFTDYGKTQHDITVKQQADVDAANGDWVKIQTAQAKALQDSATAQYKQYADIAAAAAQFFDKGTKGYKALEDVQKVYRVAEMAMSAESTVKQLGNIASVITSFVTGEATKSTASVTGTGVQLAQDAIKGESAATVGVATQAQGDPYTAWVRMAAMAATMAALGFAVSSGGDSAPDPNAAAQVQATQGTGTVLGDAKKQSDSIDASLKLLASNSNEMLPLTAQMAASLQVIENGLSGVANMILENAGISTGSNLGIQTGQIAGLNTTAEEGLSFIPQDSFTSKLNAATSNFLFGSSSSSITDAGLQFGGNFGQLEQGQGIDQYANVHTSTSGILGGLFGGNSESDSTDTQAVSAQLSQQFGLIFQNLQTTLQAAASGLGKNSDDIGNAVQNVNVSITKLSTQGLSGTALVSAINAVISATMDNVTQQVLPGLDGFAQIGEGYTQTVVRVASGVEQATVALQGLGLTAINYTDIINKQGDVATELERQSIDSAKSVSAGVANIIATFQGSATDLITLYTNLVAIQKLMNDTALQGQNLTASTIQGAGGTSQLSSDLSDYLKDYFTPAEQSAAEMKDLAAQFAALNETMPTTKDGFRALVSSIDTSTDAGQKLVGQLLSLAGAFSDAIDNANALTTATSAATVAQQHSLDEQLLQAEGNTAAYTAMTRADTLSTLTGNLLTTQEAIYAAQDKQAAISTATSNLTAAYNAQVSALNSTISSMQAFANSIQTFKDSLTLGAESALSPEDKYNQSKSIYEATLAAAQNGDTTAQGQLQTDATAFLDASKAFNASTTAYTDDFNEVQDDMSKVADYANAQVSAAQQQLSVLNTQVSSLITINNSVLSVTAAINAFNAASNGTTTVSADGTSTTTPAYSMGTASNPYGTGTALEQAQNFHINFNQNTIDAAYSAITGSAPDAATENTYLDELNSGVSIADITQQMFNSTAGGQAILQMDGSHATGLPRVPFDDYHAVLHKDEGVIDAPAMSAMRRYFNAPIPTRSVSRSNNNDDSKTIAELRKQTTELQAMVNLHSQGYQALLTKIDATNDALEGIRKKAVLESVKTRAGKA